MCVEQKTELLLFNAQPFATTMGLIYLGRKKGVRNSKRGISGRCLRQIIPAISLGVQTALLRLPNQAVQLNRAVQIGRE